LVFLLGNRKARLLEVWLLGDANMSGMAFDTGVIWRVVVGIDGMARAASK